MFLEFSRSKRIVALAFIGLAAVVYLRTYQIAEISTSEVPTPKSTAVDSTFAEQPLLQQSPPDFNPASAAQPATPLPFVPFVPPPPPPPPPTEPTPTPSNDDDNAAKRNLPKHYASIPAPPMPHFRHSALADAYNPPPVDPTLTCNTYDCSDGRARRERLNARRQAYRPTPDADRMTCTYPITIHSPVDIFYSRGWFGPVMERAAANLDKCPVKCEWMGEHDPRQNDAHILLQRGGEAEFAPLPLRNWRQKRAVFSIEHGWYKTYEADGLNATDILINYSKVADVPVTLYFLTGAADEAFEDPARRANVNWDQGDLNKFKAHPNVTAALFINNCEAYPRNAYITELMNHVKFDAYANCYRRPDESHRSADPHWREKIRVAHEYPFWFAFESFIQDDYITEKYFQGFMGNSLMVYFGAENIEEYSPGPHSFIRGDMFSGPQELAAYLRHLEEHPDEYMEYFKWKLDQTAPHPNFFRAAEWNFENVGTWSMLCRMCEFYAERYCVDPPSRRTAS